MFEQHLFGFAGETGMPLQRAEARDKDEVGSDCMLVSETLSRKISVLSFIAMVGVVLSHHPIVGGFAPLSFWNSVVQHFFYDLRLFSVQFFFVISGFWFARSAYVQGESGWRVGEFWRKKARTLLVPYLLWGLLGAIILLPNILIHAYAPMGRFNTGTVFDQGGFWECVNAIFGLGRLVPICNGPLWYVRVLLVFFLTAPLWRTLFRLGRVIPLFFGLACVLLPISQVSIPYLVGNVSSLGWLMLGMGLERWIAENRRLPRVSAVLCGVVWFALMVTNGVRHAMGQEVLPICNHLISLFSIAFFWSIADWASLYRGFMKPTFWVYCLHWPIVGYFRSGTWVLFGRNDASALFTLFVIPFVTFAVCFGAAYVTQNFAPRLYALLSGGR